MLHIRQKDSQRDPSQGAYTVVDVSNWLYPLDTHPSLIEEPLKFELVDEDIPAHAQTLKYI